MNASATTIRRRESRRRIGVRLSVASLLEVAAMVILLAVLGVGAVFMLLIR
ncbi:MAG: hypothetical protein K1X78_27305 [Verrucomicrobiaceae bacterium]|nr:hypothetical protein [Verrucomicrobiaceae bacterium]